jgi:hypothetical protein
MAPAGNECEPARQRSPVAEDEPAPAKRSRPETSNEGDDGDILTSVLYEDPAEQEAEGNRAADEPCEAPAEAPEAKQGATSDQKLHRHVSGSALNKIREEVVQAVQHPTMPAAVVASLTKKNPRPPITLKSGGNKSSTGGGGVTSPRTQQGLGSPHPTHRGAINLPESKCDRCCCGDPTRSLKFRVFWGLSRIEPTNTLRIDGLVRPCRLEEITVCVAR